jgi:hypothetical protein
MNPTLAFADEDVLSAAVPSFAVRHSREVPTYYELALNDGQSNLVHWVIPTPLKQLAKRPVLLWLLSTSPMLSSLSCVETGSMQLASARLGATADLRSELKHGVLRLNFNGQLLRGYYRLQCLPTGCGQLWQLTPIGHI